MLQSSIKYNNGKYTANLLIKIIVNLNTLGNF